MSIKQLIFDSVISILFFVIFMFMTSTSDYRLADSMFLTGSSLIILVAYNVIKLGGIFDSISYSFKKMMHSFRKRSYVNPKYETDTLEKELNKNAPPVDFYTYKTEKHKDDTFGIIWYKVVLAVLFIFVSIWL